MSAWNIRQSHILLTWSRGVIGLGIGVILSLSVVAPNAFSAETQYTDVQIWRMTELTKHEKCYWHFLEKVERSVYHGEPLRKDGLMRAINALLSHYRMASLFHYQLSEDGLLYAASIANARGTDTDHKYWKEIPDPESVVHWEANYERCFSLAR